MKCPRCQQENPSQATFCLQCGASLNSAHGIRAEASSGDVYDALRVALEQQAATVEILNVISRSPADVQPVFNAIATNAVRLCDARFCAVYRFDGELLHLAAHADFSAEALALLGTMFPRRPDEVGHVGRAVRERDVVNLPDVAGTGYAPPQSHRHFARLAGYRGFLAAPILRDGNAIGCIALGREKAEPFPEEQVSLVRTFADQAVIAIDNVRLFNETKEALEQQTATSEILRVISTSPTDLQPVLDAVVKNAARFCGADNATIFQVDGDTLRVVAHHGSIPVDVGLRVPCVRGTVSGRTVLERGAIHVTDLQAEAAEFPEGSAFARRFGHRTTLSVPLLTDEIAIGALQVRRPEANRFTDKQVALLQTFADQAVIAIENVRLFKETKEALEQQTATSEILQVISASPTDLGPVFEAILRSATQLCAGFYSLLFLCRGEEIELAATHNVPTDGVEALARRYPMSIVSEEAGLTARAARERRVQHVLDSQTDPSVPEAARRVSVAVGQRAGVAVPLLREGQAIGVLTVSRQEARAFSDKELSLLQTFADQAVIAIENVRLFNNTKEALERQTATSEILRVISSSPTDVEPVFASIAASAAQLCNGRTGAVFTSDGERLHLRSQFGPPPETQEAVRQIFPAPLSRDWLAGRAILDKALIHLPDVEARGAAPDAALAVARLAGLRSVLVCPMIREGRSIGAIFVSRSDPGLFSDEQIDLLQTFADQAVIAIENVRLFTELQSRNAALTTALDQQTATSEILRVISSNQQDVQPVFDTIVQSAVRLCHAAGAAVFRVEGGLIHEPANYGLATEKLDATRARYPRPLDMDCTPGVAILTRSVFHVPDTEDATIEHVRQTGRLLGIRSLITVPMLREEQAVGAIVVVRHAAGPFSDADVKLLRTFTEQAAIAIENVRLFTELQEKNRAVTESLDRQTATADILRVISEAQVDVQRVFDVIADSVMRLFGAWSATVYRYDGELMSLAAARGGLPGSSDSMVARLQVPHRPNEDAAPGRAVLTRTVQHIADTETDSSWGAELRRIAAERGFRSNLAVPMVRGTEAVGAIGVTRVPAGGFSPVEIALLQTFADQAVIAVENARLLTELQARTGELSRSVEQLTALGDVGRTLSSTLDLDTVLQTVVIRASQLGGTDACSVFEYDEATEAFHLRATHNLDDEVVAVARRTPIRKGEGVQGRMAVTRQPVQVPDIGAEDAYRGPLRDILLRTGTRALLAIPMLREDQLIGGLTVAKKTSGEFSSEVIELLKTFATQSALAIQNARLFREIEAKSRQLETASQHKSEFLANMSHELRTPLNAVIGFSEVLRDRMFGELNDKQEEYLNDIHGSGQHLLSLINDILDLSKIEAGRMELELTDFHLPAALDNALTLVRERAGRHGISLHAGIDGRIEYIRADERKIKQVLLNLLSNAIKFTPEGGRIDARAALGDGVIEVSVTDTGVGIAPEDQEAIFEEFRQVGTAAKKVEGTGLGLALSRRFIELHGGRIWVKSQLGEGSTFTFTIPVRYGE